MKFSGTQVYMSPKDKETLYCLVEESGLPDDQKERLMNKLAGLYLNAGTFRAGRAAQKRNLSASE